MKPHWKCSVYFIPNLAVSYTDDIYSACVSRGCLTTNWMTVLWQWQRIFPHSLFVHTNSESHPASYPMGTGSPFPGQQSVTGVWCWPLTPSSAKVKNEYELCFLSPLAPTWHVAGQLYFTLIYFYFTYVNSKKCMDATDFSFCSVHLFDLPLLTSAWSWALVGTNAHILCIISNLNSDSTDWFTLITSVEYLCVPLIINFEADCNICLR
jgi:hypothetical protein